MGVNAWGDGSVSPKEDDEVSSGPCADESEEISLDGSSTDGRGTDEGSSDESGLDGASLETGGKLLSCEGEGADGSGFDKTDKSPLSAETAEDTFCEETGSLDVSEMTVDEGSTSL